MESLIDHVDFQFALTPHLRHHEDCGLAILDVPKVFDNFHSGGNAALCQFGLHRSGLVQV